MATHSCALPWRIPWREEPDGIQSAESQRVGHNRSDLAHTQLIQQLSFYKMSLKLTKLCDSGSDSVQAFSGESDTRITITSVQFSSVAQSCLTLSDPMTAALQASLSITNSWSPPKHMSIEQVMPSNHLTLCRPLLLLPYIFPSARVFSNASALCILQ